jgi:hypothetical protein
MRGVCTWNVRFCGFCGFLKRLLVVQVKSSLQLTISSVIVLGSFVKKSKSSRWIS